MGDRIGGDPRRGVEVPVKDIEIFARYELLVEASPPGFNLEKNLNSDERIGNALGAVNRLVGAGINVRFLPTGFLDFTAAPEIRGLVSDAKSRIRGEQDAQAKVEAWVRENYKTLIQYRTYLNHRPGEPAIMSPEYSDPAFIQIFKPALERADIQAIIANLEQEAGERRAAEAKVDREIEKIPDAARVVLASGTDEQKKRFAEALRSALAKLENK